MFYWNIVFDLLLMYPNVNLHILYYLRYLVYLVFGDLFLINSKRLIVPIKFILKSSNGFSIDLIIETCPAKFKIKSNCELGQKVIQLIFI